MTKGVERSNRSAKASALEPQSKLQKSYECVRRSSRIRKMGQTSRNQEKIRTEIDLTGSDEEEEYDGADQVPNSETMPKKMEEQINFLFESMEAVKSKIEALEEENAKLREKMDVALAKLAEFDNARLACSDGAVKVGSY